MPDNLRLESLLDHYQDRLENGRVPSLDDLCQDCPELRPEFEKRIARLRKVGRLLGDSQLPATRVEPEPELSLSDDKTWVSHGTGYAPPVEIPAPPGYQVLAPLGEGGMGVVYKAKQIGLERLVALKMILAGSRARAVDLARFRNEAQAIAALRHPNIVQIFEIGEFRDQPFFSLEFCAGGTLGKAVNGEPQSPAAAAGMTEILARAIHYAHSRGIVHRDLKPGNVLLSAEPAAPSHAPSTIQADPASRAVAQAALRPPYSSLKITDFGLAKRVDDDSGRTQDGSVMGTPAYMAPEQAFGATKDVGPATDIHALGAILYELLTGRPPFKGSTVHDTLELVRHRDPVGVRTLQPQVPADLETICLKCLQKDPKKRYPSAAELADDLRRFLDHRPIQARPVGQVAHAVRWARREPRTAALVGAIGALCIAVPALLVAYSMRLSNAEQQSEAHRENLVAAKKAQKEAAEAGQMSRYLAALREAGRLRSERQPGWTWAAREQVETAAGTFATDRDTGALRSELANAVAAFDVQSVDKVAKGLQAGAVAFAPDGRLAIAPKFILPGVEYRYVVLFNPNKPAEQRLNFRIPLLLGRTYPDATSALAFSPDGKWLFLGLRNGDILRWDLRVDPIQPPVEWRGQDGKVTSFAFSPDSTWLYSGENGRVTRRLVAGDGNPQRTWRPEKSGKPMSVNGVAFWTGQYPGLLVLCADKVRLLDPESMAEIGPACLNETKWVAPTLAGAYGRLAIHPPTGTIVVSRGAKLELAYWERGICQPVADLTDPTFEEPAAHEGPIEAMSVHPSGMMLATVAAGEGVAKVWHLGKEELAVSVPAASSMAVAFNADGSILAVGGDHVTTLYEVGGLEEHTFIGRRGFRVQAMGLTHDDQIATIAARPDGRSVIASIWNHSGHLQETVIHRADNPVVTGQYRVAACAAVGCTAFHAGDDAVVFRRVGAPTTTLNAKLEAKKHFDLAVDRHDQCWMIANGDKLTVRAANAKANPRFLPLGIESLTGGRPGLACVRTGGSHVLVGCDNGFLRVLGPDGKVAQNFACYSKEDMFLKESANTVHAAAVTEDGSEAIAGTEDGRLWYFRLPSERISNWPAHQDRVTTVAFDRSGQWLASGSRDRVVRVWRRAGQSFTPYLTLQVPDGSPVRQVAFSADGKRLLVLREKETAVRVWHLDKLRDRFRDLRLEP